MAEKKQEEKQEEKPIIQMFQKDVDQASKKRSEYVDSVKKLEAELRRAGDQKSADEARALWGEAEAAPVEIFRNKGFLYRMWEITKRLYHWTKALAIGTAKYAVFAATTALKFIENALHDLGEVFSPILA